jgi:hypothetical protein
MKPQPTRHSIVHRDRRWDCKDFFLILHERFRSRLIRLEFHGHLKPVKGEICDREFCCGDRVVAVGRVCDRQAERLRCVRGRRLRSGNIHGPGSEADKGRRRFSCANTSRRFCQVKYRTATATQKPATESAFVRSNHATIDWSIEITDDRSISITIANP